MDEDKFLKSIMNYFQCNKKIAETIYKASEKNGELNRIKFITGHERSTEE